MIDIEKRKAGMSTELREFSGERSSTDTLVTFLYMLMRDEVTCGIVASLMKDVCFAHEEYAEVRYTNGHLADYAKYVAEHLRKKHRHGQGFKTTTKSEVK